MLPFLLTLLEDQSALAGLIAVVGCDGSGKTRLAADLAITLRQRMLTERRYMGLVSGETGDKIKRFPLIGRALHHYMKRKADRAQDMRENLPSSFTAFIMYLLSLWRLLQMIQIGRLIKRGVLVIAERYPQAEIKGFHYDGPGLSIERSKNRLMRKLAMQEQQLYDVMAGCTPSLVIRLAIDAETAYARKPDHSLAELQDKSQSLPLIRFNGARIFEIDASRPYDEVLATALHAIEAVVPQQRHRL